MELSGKLNEDFCAKLKVNVSEEEEEERRNEEKSNHETDRDDGGNHEEDDDDDEEEFSFVCVNPDGTLITADEAFKDGQIRPIFPLFNRDLLYSQEGCAGSVVSRHDDDDRHAAAVPSLLPPLKKVFVEDRYGGEAAASASEPRGPCCLLAGRTVVDASPEACNKSHSTGFSKLWRFRDLVHRSNSDGRDAFVFLKNQTVAAKQSLEKSDTKSKKKKGKQEKASSSSAAERHYIRSRATREEGKRKSYLPYKQVGFFTNVYELSRDIHPF